MTDYSVVTYVVEIPITRELLKNGDPDSVVHVMGAAAKKIIEDLVREEMKRLGNDSQD